MVLALPLILSSDIILINCNKESYGFGLVSKNFLNVSVKTLLCFPTNYEMIKYDKLNVNYSEELLSI